MLNAWELAGLCEPHEDGGDNCERSKPLHLQLFPHLHWVHIIWTKQTPLWNIRSKWHIFLHRPSFLLSRQTMQPIFSHCIAGFRRSSFFGECILAKSPSLCRRLPLFCPKIWHSSPPKVHTPRLEPFISFIFAPTTWQVWVNVNFWHFYHPTLQAINPPPFNKR